MVPEKLQLRNFMCYGDDVPPLHFAGLHVACISGNNGAGKSSLLDALTWALWGKARAKSDDDLIKLDQDEMEGALEFRLDAQLYRVIRRRKRGKRSGITTLDFQICDPDGTWRRLTGDTVSETQAVIDRALRIQYDTFINSAFLLQGRADEFTGRKPAERKQVLADILGLSEYEELEARAKSHSNELTKQIDLVQANIERLQTSVLLHDELEHQLNVAREEAATTEADLADHEARLHELREQATQLRELSAMRASLNQAIARQEQAQRELETRIAEQKMHVQTLEAAIARTSEIEQGVAELHSVQAELDAMDARRETWLDLHAQRRELENHVVAIRLQLEADQKVAGERVAQLQAQRERRAALTAERATLAVQSAELEQVQQRIVALRAEESRLNAQQTQLLELQVAAQKLQNTIDVQRDSLIATQYEKQRQIDALAGQVASLPDIERALREARSERIRLQTLDDELATRRDDVEHFVQQFAALQAEYKTIEATGKELNEKLRLLEQGEGRCPVCESELGADGLAHLAAEYEQRRIELRDRITQTRREMRTAEAMTQEHRAAIATLEQQVAARSKVDARSATLELQQDQARTAQTQLAEIRADLLVIERQLRDRAYAQTEQERLVGLQAQLAAFGDQQSIKRALAETSAAITTTTTRLDELRRTEQQLVRIDAELGALSSAETEYPVAVAQYKTLTTQLDDEAYGVDERAAIAAVMAAGQALGYRKEDHIALRERLETLKPWERALLKLEHARQEIKPSRDQLRLNEELAARYHSDLQVQRRQIAALDQQLVGQQQVELTLRQAELDGQRLRAKQLAAHRMLANAEQSLRECERDAELLEAAKIRAAEIADERAVYDELIQAFGKKGIQAMLIETAIPELETEANDLLSRMTDNQMHLAFEMQREKKSGDGAIETLDIRISDSLGTRDYQMYSGGEAFRVNFAIRIALSKLLARRAGASLKTLVIDEGFGSQDGKGRDRIVEAINAIEPEFERILVITHIDELKDQFQSRIEITKTLDGSTWTVV